MRKKYPGIYYMLLTSCIALIVSVTLLIIYRYRLFDDFEINKEKRNEIINLFYENKGIIEDSILNNDVNEIKKIKEIESVDDLSDEKFKYIRLQFYYEGFASSSIECGIIYSTNHNTDYFLGPWLDEYRKKTSGSGIKYLDLVSDDNLYIESIEDNYYYYQQNY